MPHLKFSPYASQYMEPARYRAHQKKKEKRKKRIRRIGDK
jgi:hypothetical protein